MKYWISLFVLSLWLWGCTAQQDNETLQDVEMGVSKELAELRSEQLTGLSYHLQFSIPDLVSQPIEGMVTIKGRQNEPGFLILDFQEGASKIKQVSLNGQLKPYEFVNHHILIQNPNNQFELEIQFEAGETSLNRNEDYLYTLLVPDRASTLFPCFDQPDLKANFTLTLQTPKDWKVVSGGSVSKQSVENEGFVMHTFNKTKPISTYLFSFAAGEFKERQASYAGKTIHMYYRETDTEKVRKNVRDIFRQHFKSVEWMESYTGIPLPFEKIDIVLIPGFQYSGMEHVGAIQYRQSSLILDASATQTEQLNRASLIAHEVAHMWFGNLVTMKWFDDVWLKEVFANFMASKIVKPNFPKVDHDLRFLTEHQPEAYEEDRTKGANPIKQELDNLSNAGTLYGNIIYHKAPIVMRQLEKIIGQRQMVNGLRAYLKKYAYSNATWDDLINILDQYTDQDLESWSYAWVKKRGMPQINVESIRDKENEKYRLSIDMDSMYKDWVQFIRPAIIQKEGSHEIELFLNDSTKTYSYDDYFCVIPDISGYAYGYFQLDKKSRLHLQKYLHLLDNEMHRASALIMMWEEMLRGNVYPLSMIEMLERSIVTEQNSLTKELMLYYLKECFWQYLTADERKTVGLRLETMLWVDMQKNEEVHAKAALFHTYVGLVTSQKGTNRLVNIWKGNVKVKELELSERDSIYLTMEIAVRDVKYAQNILQQQLLKIQNPDEKRRFSFVLPALSSNEIVRDDFFRKLKQAENREVEPWVLTALYYLHHPLRGTTSHKYIKTALQLLPEIQRTGDIFFPAQWAEANLNYHKSIYVERLVHELLDAEDDLSPKLKDKLWQAADPLFRAVEIRKIIKQSKEN
ncbi:M1 family aminopeptidase [Algivirga pacifica]|uniref:Aminopeptidase N n=1 Tax=Algivirga pacifica TaxID=1162670 RepID=A0ABP9DLW3_9BACT